MPSVLATMADEHVFDVEDLLDRSQLRVFDALFPVLTAHTIRGALERGAQDALMGVVQQHPPLLF